MQESTATTISEAEIRINKAIFELEVQWGNGRIDKDKLIAILKGKG